MVYDNITLEGAILLLSDYLNFFIYLAGNTFVLLLTDLECRTLFLTVAIFLLVSVNYKACLNVNV